MDTSWPVGRSTKHLWLHHKATPALPHREGENVAASFYEVEVAVQPQGVARAPHLLLFLPKQRGATPTK